MGLRELMGCFWWVEGVGEVFLVLQGVGIEGFHCIYRGVLTPGCWNRGVPLYIQRCPHSRVLE